MEEEKVYLLSIAGFDPSGGAGVLADIKTFEANKVHGLAVCTAITFQNDEQFEGVNWVKQEDIIRQIEVLLKKYTVKWVKIGLIENLAVLKTIVSYIKEHDEEINIIWDPIFKASAGFVFHSELDRKDLIDVCIDTHLITPNLEEIQKMIPEMEAEAGAEFISNYCNVLLKGGHSKDNKANDLLFDRKGQTVFEGTKAETDKHGTGCVLSSAILANLAKGYDIIDACKEGKEYVTDFIKSDASLLGFHYV